MFEKEIKELFELSWRVMNETDFFVSFRIGAHVHFCEIYVMNSKWESGKAPDARYTIYTDTEVLKEESAEQCKLAKAHLLRLLIDGRCPLNAESDGAEAPADNGTDSGSERTFRGTEQAESVHS
nr:MAG TPA: hypothetical protein [Caudoviricetes sp.]